ncbi:hypothetical protein [Erythrobacter sp. A6_0]|uniref:hypothetical protein n=1 Tax=Erythrobacter sp. A6_0 TaxID=2821089 RepID=UPI001ADA282B|nr:hypothetical protein [Erythrobacter sp. A6_0]MBO9510883.1 hypothetical protein [Erythrobacter sp. A6_0]
MKELNNKPLAPCERLLALPLLLVGATKVAEWQLPGMPQGCLDLPECNLVLAGTADAERFDFAMLKTSTDHDRDILLMRMTAGQFPALADIVLRSTAEPILLTNLIPCRQKERLWFVPSSNGRSVEVTEKGLAMRWKAPISPKKLKGGCDRLADEISRFLRGVTF